MVTEKPHGNNLIIGLKNYEAFGTYFDILNEERLEILKMVFK